MFKSSTFCVISVSFVVQVLFCHRSPESQRKTFEQSRDWDYWFGIADLNIDGRGRWMMLGKYNCLHMAQKVWDNLELQIINGNIGRLAGYQKDPYSFSFFLKNIGFRTF